MLLPALVRRILTRVPEPGLRPPDTSVLDTYVTTAPSPQNAVDLFEGTWSSKLPLDGVTAGPIPLFSDDRVEWALRHFGDLTGKKVLELGPLEAGHTYQLLGAGAEVVAIESQAKAYLKCLVVKELLGLDRASFLLGDFVEYLRSCGERYDVCFASGVLYHLRNPVEAIALAARAAGRLLLWTHYYDEEVCRGERAAVAAVLRPRGERPRGLHAHPPPVRLRQCVAAQGILRRQRALRQVALAGGPVRGARALRLGGRRRRLRRPGPPARPGTRSGGFPRVARDRDPRTRGVRGSRWSLENSRWRIVAGE